MFWKSILFGALALLAGSAQAATAGEAATPENGLGEAERQQLISEAKPLLRNECFRLFEQYLDEAGQKSFFYSIDQVGRYACGKSAKQDTRAMADDAALAACLRDKSRRGARMPNLTCRAYARENEVLLSQADFGLEIVPAQVQELSPEATRGLIEAAGEILGVKCLAEFKLYIASQGHKAFYYAMDEKGSYACGSADHAIAASAAHKVALKHCDTHRDKQKVQASCKLYAEANEIVAKPEDFPVEQSQESAR